MHSCGSPVNIHQKRYNCFVSGLRINKINFNELSKLMNKKLLQCLTAFIFYYYYRISYWIYAWYGQIIGKFICNHIWALDFPQWHHHQFGIDCTRWTKFGAHNSRPRQNYNNSKLDFDTFCMHLIFDWKDIANHFN